METYNHHIPIRACLKVYTPPRDLSFWVKFNDVSWGFFYFFLVLNSDFCINLIRGRATYGGVSNLHVHVHSYTSCVIFCRNQRSCRLMRR